MHPFFDIPAENYFSLLSAHLFSSQVLIVNLLIYCCTLLTLVCQVFKSSHPGVQQTYSLILRVTIHSFVV